MSLHIRLICSTESRVAEAAAAAKKARKAEKKNPLTAGQKRTALVGAYTCFTLCGMAVLYGIYLIVPYFHQ